MAQEATAKSAWSAPKLRRKALTDQVLEALKFPHMAKEGPESAAAKAA